MLFKNFKKTRICALVLALMMLLTLALGSCLQQPEKSPTEYMRRVEGKALKGFVSSMTDLYKDAELPDYKKGFGGKETIELELSESAIDMIEALAEGIDLSWLTKIGIDADVYMSDSVIGVNMLTKLGGSDLIGIEFIMDMAGKNAYFTIPDILSKYLKMDTSEAFASSDADISAMFSQIGDFSKLPDAKTVNSLADKYIDMFLDGVNKVERTEGTLTANGVEEKCTVLKITVTETDARAICKKILESAKNDTELKSVIASLCDWYVDIMAIADETWDLSGEELCTEFYDNIDYMLEDIAENDSEALEDEEAIIITDYINGKDEIIGRTISDEDEDLLFYGTATGKDGFGFELAVEGTTLLVGKGNSDKKLNGTFTFTEEGTDYATVTLKDIDMKKLEKGSLSGIVDIKIEEFPDEVPAITSALLSAYTIRLELDTNTKDGGKVALAIMSGESCFAKLTFGVSFGGDYKAVAPIDGDTIEISEDLDASALLSEVDFDALLEKLRNSTIPEEYVSLIEQYVSLFSVYYVN